MCLTLLMMVALAAVFSHRSICEMKNGGLNILY